MNKKHTFIYRCIGLAAACCLSGLFHFRADLTGDKEYTLSDYTKNLLKGLNEDVRVIIYLDGSLDSDYLRLKKATREILDEFNGYSPKKITPVFYNPNNAGNDEKRNRQRLQLLKRGMKDEILVETDNEGRMIQKSVFPWADIIIKNDTASVCLLSDNTGKSKQERINASIEDLEYQLTDALTELTEKDFPEIAFLEGHDELPEVYVYDAVETLSRHYTVFRGSIADIDEIPPYKVLIIAGPTKKFSEKEKYLLDRYIVSGGNVLFLMGGVVVSYEDLWKKGQSASMINDVNLDDLFFRYGFRINPVLIQDLQCAYIPLKVGNDETTFHPAPWYYAPLLHPSENHPITGNMAPVKAEFVSSIDFTGNDTGIKKQLLLTSSGRSHIVSIPETITPDAPQVKETSDYFNRKNIPAAALLEGRFPSAFSNRMPPEGVKPAPKPAPGNGKIIVAASANIIRNEIQWTGNKGTALPLGYDSYMDRQFGNRDFIVNSVNYLAGKESQMLLRSKHNTLRLLDKTKINSGKKFWILINIGVPLVLVIIPVIGFQYLRKRKYGTIR
ncbi:MAG: gliding motility-associated ABC transporter substrate-binding protein GldG [Candidatus Azobacteroides sp.]|nr:gliding motility-associated ABC transporter substrate-binding protein GldG [Candidatus Azobacteroides sp.]